MGRSLVLPVIGALALAACSDAGQAELARGNVLASQKKLEPAAEAYREAARALPGKARPLELLGHVLFDLGQRPEARAAYAGAAKAEPGLAIDAEIGLARLDAEEGKLAEALTRLDDTLKTHADSLYARLSRANLLMRRGADGDARRALEDTEAALVTDPANAAALYTRGCAFIAAHQIEPARQAFLRLERADAASPLSSYGLARAAGAANDRAEAIHHLREAKRRARAVAGAWKPDQVRADPAFRFMQDDADLARILSEP